MSFARRGVDTDQLVLFKIISRRIAVGGAPADLQDPHIRLRCRVRRRSAAFGAG
jgi:hypothetical protein